MIVRVIYRDQSAGVVENNLLDDLIKRGSIAAYNSADKWIPIEPKGCSICAGINERMDETKTLGRRTRSH